MNRPYASASEQNKQVIYDAIESYLAGDVLEIGSGSGQHAVFFAAHKPELIWQTSDLAENLPGIELWIESSSLGNLPPPIELDVLSTWPPHHYDFICTANTLHIMDREMVAQCIHGVGECLVPGGVFAVYGPFNYGGEHTSPSNAQFDQYLKARDPVSGIKDFEWLNELAECAGMYLIEDIEMPANNRTLIWQNRTL